MGEIIKMKFTKMQGLGNDYVYVNCFKEKIDNPPELAKFVSDRHFGIQFSCRFVKACKSDRKCTLYHLSYNLPVTILM